MKKLRAGKPPRLLAVLAHVPRTLLLLGVVQLLLLVWLLMGISAWFSVGEKELQRALEAQQQVVIDAKTGKLLSPEAEAEFSDAPSKKPSDATSEVKTPSNSALAPAYDVAPSVDNAVAPDATTPAAPEQTEQAPSANATAATGDTLDTAPAPALAPVPRSNNSLVPAPAPEVSDITPNGVLPKKGGKHAIPYQLYAKRYVWAKEDVPPSVSILVVGLGLNPRSMQAALDLPAEVSLAIGPYGDPRWVEYARNQGHEVWLDLPAQTNDFPRHDPGVFGIHAALNPEQVTKTLRRAMMQINGYVGFVLPIGQTVMPEAKLAAPLLEEATTRGLRVVVPTSDQVLSQFAYVTPHRANILEPIAIIDSTSSEAFIRARLAKLEEHAQENGHVFAVVGSTPLSLKMVSEWTKGLKKKNIALVPVTALYSAPAKEE